MTYEQGGGGRACSLRGDGMKEGGARCGLSTKTARRETVSLFVGGATGTLVSTAWAAPVRQSRGECEGGMGVTNPAHCAAGAAMVDTVAEA